VGLGVLGGTLAVMLQVAPPWAAALALPGLLVMFGKREMDRARRRSRDLALTSGVGRAVAGTLHPEVAFAAITSVEVREALKLDGFSVVPSLVEPAFESHVACEVDRPELRTHLGERSLSARSTVLETSTGLASVALPFGSRDAAPIGALVAWRLEHGPFTSEEVLLLETLADYAAVALETARLARDAAQAEGQRQAEVMQREALRQSEQRFRSLVQNASDAITILGADGTIAYASPTAERFWGHSSRSLIGQNIMEFVHPEDLHTAHRHFSDVLSQPGVSVPVELLLRHIDGTLRQFEVVASNLLHDQAVGGIVATYHDITQQKQLQRELSRMAFRDSLTDLPNRAVFLDRLEHGLLQADRQGQRVAVMFMDLDRFKIVNDSLGHPAGDALLVEVAARLRACLREEDSAARLGGDEFTILLEDVADEREAAHIAQRISSSLSTPVVIDGRELFVSASIGIALSTPYEDVPDGLLRKADLALYRAKAEGRARFAVFDPALEIEAVRRLEIESDLQRALERGEFRVYYQPIVDLATNRMNGLEALVRWQRPGHGLLSPAAFLSIAEETGLIVPIGEWVLAEACRQLREWEELRAPDLPLTISVNLAARQFQDASLVDVIERALLQSGLNPAHLKLEITESAVMENAELAITTLYALKRLGIRVAIDDFGTGYSSLTYLKQFPVDNLKVDRSFVEGVGQDAQDTAIIQSVVALAQTLKMRVTAEGVETDAQRLELARLGCEQGQGYLFAEPLPAAKIRALLEQETSAIAKLAIAA